MANLDSMTGSEGDGGQTSGGTGGRRYRKRDQKRGSLQSGDSSNAEMETNQSEADTRKIKLNRLSNYEVDNVKMANVFGNKPEAQKQVSSSMRLNPLYDQNGTVEVSADQAQVAKIGDNSSQDSASQDDAARAGRSKKYKRPKKAADEEEEEPEDRPQETKINYSKNFRFGKRSDDENGAAGGKNGVKKLTTFGVVMPSRVKQNTAPNTQLPAAGGGPSQYALGAQTSKSKADIEAANRRREMRRRWRYVIILILIILVFGLILTVVLYFATKAP